MEIHAMPARLWGLEPPYGTALNIVDYDEQVGEASRRSRGFGQGYELEV